MPVLIDGVQYFSAADIIATLGISRTTFWRWRDAGEIPAGRKYPRRKMRLFTVEEVEVIRAFANRLEPVEGPNPDQMRLFNVRQ